MSAMENLKNPLPLTYLLSLAVADSKVFVDYKSTRQISKETFGVAVRVVVRVPGLALPKIFLFILQPCRLVSQLVSSPS